MLFQPGTTRALSFSGFDFRFRQINYVLRSIWYEVYGAKYEGYVCEHLNVFAANAVDFFIIFVVLAKNLPF